jgi:hypothetical protein
VTSPVRPVRETAASLRDVESGEDMNPTLAFPDNHKAAIAARDFGVSASGQLHGLTLLPYSFLSPEYTVWWLVPGPHAF